MALEDSDSGGRSGSGTLSLIAGASDWTLVLSSHDLRSAAMAWSLAFSIAAVRSSSSVSCVCSRSWSRMSLAASLNGAADCGIGGS